MSDKQSEFKDNPTTYHAQMRHQSKNKLELHDQSEYKLKSMTYHTSMRHETKMRLKESRTHTHYECERQRIQDDNDPPHPSETSK